MIITDKNYSFTGFSIELFKPLPQISGFIPSSHEITSGELLTVTGVNATDTNAADTIAISGYNLATNQTEISLIDGNNPLLFDGTTLTGDGSVSAQTPPLTGYPGINQFTKISGVVSSNFIGSGQLFLVHVLDNALLAGGLVSDSFTAVSGGLDKAVAKPFALSTPHGKLSIKPAPPVLTSFTPTSGSTNATISLVGENLQYATGLLLRDEENSRESVLHHSGFVSSSETLIEFTPPDFNGRTGELVVGTPWDLSNGLSPFSFIPLPVISGFTPVHAKAREIVVVSGRNFDTVTGFGFSTSSDFVPATSWSKVEGSFGVTGIRAYTPLEGSLPADQNVSVTAINAAGSAKTSGLWIVEGTKRIFGDLSVSGEEVHSGEVLF